MSRKTRSINLLPETEARITEFQRLAAEEGIQMNFSHAINALILREPIDPTRFKKRKRPL